MLRTAFAAMIAVVFVSACAAPEREPPPAAVTACAVPLDLALAELRRAVPADRLTVERHEGDRAKAAVDAINAIEPETDYEADVVIVAYLQGAPAAVILLATAGCVTLKGVLPAEDARRLAGRGV